MTYGDLAGQILAAIPDQGDLLFPARGCDDRPFSGWSKVKAVLDERSGVDFTLHDLRRSWATHVAVLDVHPWVFEAHLNHVSGTISEGHCANGQKLKCLTVTDEGTKEGLAIEVEGRLRSGRVIEVLSRLVSERGAPVSMQSDNGSEFVSRALLKWIADQGIETALINPGKLWQNGTVESFNGKFRDECLSMEWFRSRAEAKVVIENWRRHYNEVRPHSGLGYLTPAEFAAGLKSQDPASVPATGRIAAVDGASALRPVAQPPEQGHEDRRETTRADLSS